MTHFATFATAHLQYLCIGYSQLSTISVADPGMYMCWQFCHCVQELLCWPAHDCCISNPSGRRRTYALCPSSRGTCIATPKDSLTVLRTQTQICHDPMLGHQRTRRLSPPHVGPEPRKVHGEPPNLHGGIFCSVCSVRKRQHASGTNHGAEQLIRHEFMREEIDDG